MRAINVFSRTKAICSVIVLILAITFGVNAPYALAGDYPSIALAF